MILSGYGLIVALVIGIVAWASWAAGREYGESEAAHRRYDRAYDRGYTEGWLEANDRVIQHVYDDIQTEGTEQEKP